MQARVLTQKFSANFQLVSPQLLRMEKCLPKASLQQTDVTAGRWLIFRKLSGDVEIKARRMRSWYSTSGDNLFLLVPPMASVDWNLSGKDCEFEVFHSSVSLPFPAPSSPMVLRPEKWRDPSSVEDIFHNIDSSKEVCRLTVERTDSIIAREIRRLIVETFQTAISLEEIARELRVHPSVASRAFKDCYGLSPVEFRTKLRIDHSLSQLQMGNVSVLEAGMDAGFESESRFFANFSKIHDAAPGNFRLRQT